MGSESNSRGEAKSNVPEQIQGYFVPVPPNSLAADIGFIEIWRKFSRYKLMMVSIIIACTALAIAMAVLKKPVYRSEVLLATTSGDDSQGNWSALASQLGGVASLAGINPGGSNDKNQAIAILKSRSFMEEFISSEELMPILFAGRWDVANNRWNIDNPDDIPTMSDAYGLFDREIRTVAENKKTGLVTLGIEWSDHVLAARWANLLIERLNEHLRTLDIAEAERSIEFLNQELEKNSVLELRQGMFRLIEHQVETVMLANVRKEYAFKILDPAVVADADKYIRPNRVLIVASGIALGALIALFVAFLRIAWRNLKDA